VTGAVAPTPPGQGWGRSCSVPGVHAVLGSVAAPVSGVVAGPWRAYHPGRQHVFRWRSLVRWWPGWCSRSLNSNPATTRLAVFAKRRPCVIFRHLCGHRRPAWPLAFPAAKWWNSAAVIPESSAVFSRSPAAPCDHRRSASPVLGLETWLQNYCQRETTTLQSSPEAWNHDQTPNPNNGASTNCACWWPGRGCPAIFPCLFVAVVCRLLMARVRRRSKRFKPKL